MAHELGNFLPLNWASMAVSANAGIVKPEFPVSEQAGESGNLEGRALFLCAEHKLS
jgi:hypothetical protein